MTPSKPWKSSQFSRKIVLKLASYAIYIMIPIIQIYSGITRGRVLSGEFYANIRGIKL